ncbi:MAG: rod shape-determining protein MreD [Acidimicrobiales bacterium]
MTRGPARLFLLVVAALVVQHSLLVNLRVAGVRPDLLLVMAVAAGIVGGRERGAVVGFAVGVAADLLAQTPFGLSSLTFALIGYGVGTVQAGVIRLAWWIPLLTGLAASAAGVLLYGFLGALLGQAGLMRPGLVGLAVVVGALNAALVPFVVRAVAWASPSEGDQAFAR